MHKLKQKMAGFVIKSNKWTLLNDTQNTALMLAVTEGRAPVVKSMLADMNKDALLRTLLHPYEAGNTLLIVAAQTGHEAIVQIILAAINKAGMSATEVYSIFNTSNNNGETALMWASDKKKIFYNICKTLKSAQIPCEERLSLVKSSDMGGNTTLMWAASSGTTEVIQFVLDFMGNARATSMERLLALHAFDLSGKTVLMRAAEGGHKDAVRFMLAEMVRLGVGMAVARGDQDMAVTLKKFRMHSDIVQMLFSASIAPKEGSKEKSLAQHAVMQAIYDQHLLYLNFMAGAELAARIISSSTEDKKDKKEEKENKIENKKSESPIMHSLNLVGSRKKSLETENIPPAVMTKLA